MPANITPIRQPTQYSCMSASVRMCLGAMGLNDAEITTESVNKVLGALPKRGATWEQAMSALQHYGCRGTLVVPSTLNQVREWTDKGLPVIIAWNPENREWAHASVIYDVTDTEVYIADPNCPDPNQLVRNISHHEFYGKWFEKYNGYLVRRPALCVSREVDTQGRQVMASKKSASIPHPLKGKTPTTYLKKLAFGSKLTRGGWLKEANSLKAEEVIEEVLEDPDAINLDLNEIEEDVDRFSTDLSGRFATRLKKSSDTNTKKALVSAAYAVASIDANHPVWEKGYPSHWPSFDELAHDIRDWLNIPSPGTVKGFGGGPKDAQKRIQALADAMGRLSAKWDDTLDEGYPSKWKSFDEEVDFAEKWAQESKKIK